MKEHWLIATLLPHVQPLREIARLLAAGARGAAQEGDGDTSYADVVAILKMSHHCEEQPFFVNALVAAALQKLAYQTTEELLSANPSLWSDAQLRNLAHGVAAAEIDWQRPFQGERYSFYDVVQRLYTDDGHGDGRITDEGLGALRMFAVQGDIDDATGLRELRMELGSWALEVLAPASLYVVASRSDLVDTYNRILDQEEVELDRPLWEKLCWNATAKIQSWPQWKKSRYLPIALWMPAISSIRYAIERHRGQLDGVLLGIALELYHREHGNWPESLDELAPRWIPVVPVDRLNGKPLHYRLVGDRPVIYSTGVDGDGGRAAKDEKGKSDSQLAGPKSIGSDTATRPDGDWVIWSTVGSDE